MIVRLLLVYILIVLVVLAAKLLFGQRFKETSIRRTLTKFYSLQARAFVGLLFWLSQ